MKIEVKTEEQERKFDCGITGTIIKKIIIEVEVDEIWQAHMDFKEEIKEQVLKVLNAEYEAYLDSCE